MIKGPYKDPHTQIRNDILLNLCRVNLPKRDYYRFLMVLFRETFGRKRQKGSALGKWTPWVPAIWIEHGMAKDKVSKCKAELLSLRIIRRNGNRIGFNWHCHQWKVEWYEPPLKLEDVVRKTYSKERK